VDVSSVLNNFGGWYNAPNYPNFSAFAAVKADKSITAWGESDSGGAGAPSGLGIDSTTGCTYTSKI
jgi:hypothetical protein